MVSRYPYLLNLLSTGTGSERFRHHDIVPVEYGKNSDSYRSEDFSKEHSDKVVLSAGCSFTFGVGLPFQYIWPVVLQNKLGLSHHANISAAGWSASTIIDSVYTYIRLYGKPSAVTMLLPNLQRYYKVTVANEEKKPSIRNILFHHLSPQLQADDVIQTDKDVAFVSRLMNQDTLLYDLAHRLKQLEEYLLAIDVPLVYSCWDRHVSEKLQTMSGLENFFPISQDEREQYLFDNKDGYTNDYEKFLWDDAADRPLPHPGISENKFFAELFYRELKERYDI